MVSYILNIMDYSGLGTVVLSSRLVKLIPEGVIFGDALPNIVQ